LQSGDALDVREQDGGFAVWLEGECVAQSPVFADGAACQAAIQRLREAVGLRSFRSQAVNTAGEKKKAGKSARFVSFRDDDGSFRFRLLDAAGEQLLLSRSFADGKAAGMVNKRLQSGEALDIREQDGGFAVWLDDECVAQSPAFADSSACQAAIQRLREALAPQE
jgi:tryptophanyl-tRNA synthetase